MERRKYLLIAFIFVLLIGAVAGLAYSSWQRDAQLVEHTTNDSPVATTTQMPDTNTPPQGERCAPDTPPSITLIAPNGGEVITGGQEVTVTWQACNLDPQTPIGLTLSGFPYPNDVQIFLGEWTPVGTGKQTVTIANAIIPGKYVINISTPPESSPSADDWSDNAFQIN